MRVYRGSCHCRAITFEVHGTLEEAVVCNCSICTKKGYLHWIVPREQFRLLTGEQQLATYRFNTMTAKHHFCPTCGIAPFYIARSDPDKIDVNVRCLESVAIEELPLRTFDGKNWEQAYAQYRRDD